MFETERFDRVIHLAAQAGVRYSLQNPHAYAQSNLVGFVNILKVAATMVCSIWFYASSSSVWRQYQNAVFGRRPVDHPVSLYAANQEGQRIDGAHLQPLVMVCPPPACAFSPYTPLGRPDMAPMLFTKAITADQPIKVFNHGPMKRDFTYIDDIVAGVVATMDRVPSPMTDLTAMPHPSQFWRPTACSTLATASQLSC